MTAPALLVRGGCVYTADEQDTMYPSGSVLAVGDRIAAVGDTAAVAETVAQLPPDIAAGLRTVDAGRMMVLPGLVNAHWHDMFALRLPLRGALRPAHDRDDEPGFLAHGGDLGALTAAFDSFHPLGQRLTDEEAGAIARYSVWTQLRCGTTTLGDTGSVNHPDQIAAAADALGLRCSITTWATDAVCPPGERRYRRTRDADEVLADLESLLRRHGARNAGTVRVRPSALYVGNMSDELGHGLRELVERYDAPFVTHVAALRHEVEFVRAYYGATPMRRLAELGLLTDRLMAVHAAFVDEEERKLMAAANVHLSHSPAKYGPAGESTMTETGAIPELIRAGLDVSLSTDGAGLPIGGMPEAMRAAWQMHNEMAADPGAVPPSRALAMATRVPARGLRWDDQIGSLAVGKRADLVLVPTDDWRYVLNPRPLEAFLTLGGSSDIDTVVVGGRIRLRGGAHPDVDEQELRQRYLDALRSFSARELHIDEAALAGAFDRRT